MGDMHKALFLGKFQIGGGGGGTSDVQDLVLTMDPLTYVITAYLVDGNGTRIGTERTIDIPLESTIIGASYDNVTKDLTFALTSGSTLTVPLGDIIYGLQPLIDSTHKLSADLVDDSTSTNKLAHVDNAGGLWIGSAQYIKIMDSDSYAALAAKEDMLYMVYPTPTPAPSLSMGGAKSEISEGGDEKSEEAEEKELKEPIVEEKEDFQEKWGLSDNDMDEPMAMRWGGWD